LDFYAAAEKQQTFKVELDFTATQPKATELLAEIILSKEKEPPCALHSPCATSAHCPAVI